jgi:hypothetical protein
MGIIPTPRSTYLAMQKTMLGDMYVCLLPTRVVLGSNLYVILPDGNGTSYVRKDVGMFLYRF